MPRDDRRLRRPALRGSRRRGDPAVSPATPSPTPTSPAWRAKPTAVSAIRRSRRWSQLGANTFVLELFHGPTLAFKDVAMQLLARLMDHVLAARGERRTIVVATSGDTGGAAVEAFRDRSQVDVIVLFPQGRISDVQRRMMTTARGANIHALAIEGTFDDCQAIVKGMFNHAAFRDRVRLSGVNSINWARIVAQAVYYFTAAVALGAPHRKVAFTVPTGNFGDIYAGYVAQRMGLPIDRLVIATNVNDILARTLATGAYELRDVVPTTSPSMDIQVASNFERLLFDAYDRDGGAVRALMGSLAQSRPVHAVGAARCRRSARCSPPIAPTRRKLPPPSARSCARPAISSIRIPPSALRWPKRSCAIRRCRWWCCRPRIRPNFPMRSRRPAASGRHCRIGFPISINGRSASPCCRPISLRSSVSSWRRAVPRKKERRHERSGDRP